jgi:hypothetical protein
VCAAPDDQSFLDKDGCYDSRVQIKPSGGYYDTLIAQIRAEFPWLIVIGNSGGKLFTNEVGYAGLVDVLVSFEQSSAYATMHPKEVSLQTGIEKQAALFHGTSMAELPAARSAALQSMFTHFYATNATTDTNVWGQVSEHLEAQVDALLAQP